MYVELTQSKGGVFFVLTVGNNTISTSAAELRLSGFPVVGAVGGHGNHGINVERLVVLVKYFLTQLDFTVGVFLVTETAYFLLTIATTEVGLHIAVAGNADAGAEVAVEINGGDRGGSQSSGHCCCNREPLCVHV